VYNKEQYDITTNISIDSIQPNHWAYNIHGHKLL